MERLSDKQTRVLALLLRRRHSGEYLPTAPEISRKLARDRGPHWALSALNSLDRRGLVRKAGSAFSGARCWEITEEGIAAIGSDVRAARK
jgi:hypothetical protein